LNEEYGKIEKPFIPTLRMGVPIYYNEVFKGVLIMCWDAKNLASARIHTWPPDA
jgi:hypothetical protein